MLTCGSIRLIQEKPKFFLAKWQVTGMDTVTNFDSDFSCSPSFHERCPQPITDICRNISIANLISVFSLLVFPARYCWWLKSAGIRHPPYGELFCGVQKNGDVGLHRCQCKKNYLKNHLSSIIGWKISQMLCLIANYKAVCLSWALLQIWYLVLRAVIFSTN